ncbi:class I SAM-dependent methyltransferase [Pelagibius sp. Alg239-R121]|uniref:class I SAM-dependent methyltransferase n=1 Tax=Pelagibius sp. Alg239-R121 TaxID=2993448 RepID=UPI0024A6E230|nr:class I SAM-dependent methyltransferase [Pelagibius sp. Alg239-R121]
MTKARPNGVKDTGVNGTARYRQLVDHYESCFLEHGPTALGVDWPDEGDLAVRFDVMTDLIRPTGKSIKLLDLGCGPGLLLDHLAVNPLTVPIDYLGIDLSGKMISAARQRHADRSFEVRDLLTDPLAEQSVDYVIMNGLLTEKRELSQGEMVTFAREIIAAAYRAARIGIAFNVMSTQVDWMRDDLFHWACDDVLEFVTGDLSRHAVIRADYGLYEYTTYLYRTANR